MKSPGFGDQRKATMQDIALATGAQFVSEEAGLGFEDAGLDVLGTAEQVIVTKDNTIIMGGAGEKAIVNQRI